MWILGIPPLQRDTGAGRQADAGRLASSTRRAVDYLLTRRGLELFLQCEQSCERLKKRRRIHRSLVLSTWLAATWPKTKLSGPMRQMGSKLRSTASD
jgi:hypothetical protein